MKDYEKYETHGFFPLQVALLRGFYDNEFVLINKELNIISYSGESSIFYSLNFKDKLYPFRKSEVFLLELNDNIFELFISPDENIQNLTQTILLEEFKKKYTYE